LREILTRIRGAIGNAFVWAAAWAVGSIVLLTLFVILGIDPVIPPGAAVLRIAARFGLTGFVVGAGFSGFLAYVYRDERITSIRSAPFILGGAVVSAIVAPMAGASAVIGAILGGATAGLTLTAAKRVDRHALGDGGSEHFLQG
jgi:hypothetical protein